MTKNFTGDGVLLKYYNDLTADLAATYRQGPALCFAGPHGTGKTFCCTSVLKRALEKGYTGLYVTLTDIINFLVNDPQHAVAVRQELLTVDFLVIDEFDPRHIASTEKAADLYGRVLEDIFRTRVQNSLPILMCTNSLKAVESFRGALRTSIESLFNYLTEVSILGKDMRKEKL